MDMNSIKSNKDNMRKLFKDLEQDSERVELYIHGNPNSEPITESNETEKIEFFTE